MFMGLWVLGGLIPSSAHLLRRLGSARPNAGGDIFLREAYGRGRTLLRLGALLVIQPGAIAAVAFVIGDYANVVFPLGPYGPGIHAMLRS